MRKGEKEKKKKEEKKKKKKKRRKTYNKGNTNVVANSVATQKAKSIVKHLLGRSLGQEMRTNEVLDFCEGRKKKKEKRKKKKEKRKKKKKR